MHSARVTARPWLRARWILQNEVDIGQHLGRSLNVCYLYGAFEDDVAVDLVMELCTGGQLWDK